MVEAKQTAPDSAHIRVELFGLARIITGTRKVPLTVPRQAGACELAGALAEVRPELVGQVILENLSGFQPSYTFNLNGAEFAHEEQMQLKTGDTVLLFSSQVGG